MRVDPVQDHLRAIVERLVEVVHERLLVHAPFVERPRRLRPAERPVVAEPLEQIARERRRRRHRHRRIVRLPVHRRDVQLQLAAGVHQQQLRHAVHPDEEVDPEVEVDPAAHLARLERNRLARRFRPSRSSPRGSSGSSTACARPRAACSSRDRRAIAVAQRRPFRRIACDLLPDDRVRRPDRARSCATSFSNTQALQDAAELRVAFFVSAQVGREVVEGPHRPADVGQRKAGRAARRSARLRAGTSPARSGCRAHARPARR